MLLPCFFVINFNKYSALPEVQLPENTYLSYKITATPISLINSFYKKLFSLPNKYPFCLLIDLQEDLKESVAFETIINSLITFSFHFNYIKTKHDNPLIIFETGERDADNYIEIARQIFKSQGYDDIETMVIYNNKILLQEEEKKNICFNFRENMDNLFSEYINSIGQLTSSGPFFFFLDDPGKIPEILNVIQKAEIVIREDLPQAYYLLKENRSLTTREYNLLVKLKLLQEQFDSLSKYNISSDTRYKKQIIDLITFYKYEHEILPLWYKQFGHILKVIMGKRTFRSLFNDNVKKYKES